MASFYKRKLKDCEVWYVNLVLADGRRKSINTKCESKAAAREVAVEFQRKILLGLDPTKPEPPKQNVIALFQRFIEESRRDWSPDTIALYRDTQTVLQDTIGAIPLTDMSRSHREVIIKYLTERGAVMRDRSGRVRKLRAISPHTVNRHLRNITRFLNWCVEEEIVKGWQPPRLKAMQVIAVPRESFTPDELAKILETARTFRQNGQPVHLYFAFLAFSGLRRNEALNLMWQDVDLARGLLHVPPGKTKRRETVPITAPLLSILNAVESPRSGRVFPALSEEVSDTFKAVCEAADVPYRPLHRLRATFATQLSAEGLPPMAIQRLARHRKVDTTHDWYYQPEQNALKESANKALDGSAFATALLRILDK